MRFKVYSLDVWGNDKDGYTVNDCMDTGITVAVSDDSMCYYGIFDDSVIHALKRAKLIKKSARYNRFDIEGDIEFTIYINDAKDLYPLYELRRVK